MRFRLALIQGAAHREPDDKNVMCIDANDVTQESDKEMEYEEDSGRVIRRHDNRRCSGRSDSGSYMRSLAIEQQDYRRSTE